MKTNQSQRTETTENSVLIALRELTALESDREQREREAETAKRLAAEASRRAREEEEAARARAEAAQREADAKKAELEARARAEAEAERDQRMATMRAQLAAIESDRAQLRAALHARVEAPESPRRSFGLAFGLSSVVAAALAGLLVMQAQTRPLAPIAAPSRAPEVARVESAPAVVEVVAAPEAEAAPAAEIAPAPVERPHRHGRRDRPLAEARDAVDHGTIDHGLDFDDEDGLLPTDAHRSR